MDCKIDQNAIIGRNVAFGYGVRIYGNVRIGDNCSIGDFCLIGVPSGAIDSSPLVLGGNSTVRSHSVIYEGSTIASHLETGHHVVIRDGARIGENLRIGSFSDVEGACTIGDFARIHGYAHIGRGTEVGDFAWIYSLTTLMNDPLPPSHVTEPVRVGDMATVCVNAQIMPGTTIGRGAMIATGAIASGEIPPGVLITGPNGDISGYVRFLMHMESRTRHPWHRHFADAYPERVRNRIRQLGAEIEAEVASSNQPSERKGHS